MRLMALAVAAALVSWTAFGANREIEVESMGGDIRTGLYGLALGIAALGGLGLWSGLRKNNGAIFAIGALLVVCALVTGAVSWLLPEVHWYGGRR
ncbi:MAG: hypothetical protein F4Y03_04555 [Alphaproteobacteria bacterium]|nr:hypothetical protein [Alphaproteobacteria bacterium]